MPIQLTIERQTLQFDSDTIGIGRAAENQVSLPNDSRLAAQHAVLRSVNGRWIIESREGGPVRIGNGRPAQFAWLNPGDVIHLTEAGPDLVFQPSTSGAAGAQVIAAPAKPVVALPPVTTPKPLESAPTPRPAATGGLPPKTAATKELQRAESDSATGTFIPANDWRTWMTQPIVLFTAALSLLVIVGTWSLWPRSPRREPPASADVTSAEASPNTASNATPDTTVPVTDPPNSESDPRDFLVLVGIGDLRNDSRPHVLGVGWLWNEQTAVVPRALGDFLDSLLVELKKNGTPRQGCVIQGISLEIAEISSPAECPEISVLRLKDAAELSVPIREQWQIATTKDIQRRRGQGKKFKHLSFASLPRSPEVERAQKESGEQPSPHSFANSLSWQAYDPELAGFTTRLDEDAGFVFEQGRHFLKPSNATTPLERVGLMINDERKIVGMTLPDASVVWTDSLQRALKTP